jgi:Fic family protein
MDPYTPEPLPINLAALNWQKIGVMVSNASAALAHYNGILDSINHPAIFLSPLETREAVLSSRIEGTVTTVDEILRYEVNLKPESRAREYDIIEVLNYRKAARHAQEWLQRGLPFNLALICAIQKELLQGARGENKQPGKIRREQVWIGPRNRPIEEASYVPPEPLGIESHLDNLFQYMKLADQEVLIQTAIMHAQFEIIHPFHDGNGRTGRILIPLFLWWKKRISSPMFYISEYFDEQRDAYVEGLRRITQAREWEQWILFFLQAVTTQAKRNSEKAGQVIDLHKEMRARIARMTKSPQVFNVVDALFVTPVFKPPELFRMAGLEPKSAHRILARLKDEKILLTLQEHAGRSAEVLVFEELYNIIR